MRAGAGCPTTCPVSSAERAVAVGKVARAPGILRSTARMRVLKNLALERKTHARISRDCVEASRVVRGFESRDPRPSSGARQRTITRSETSLHSTATFAFCVQSVSLRELAAHDHHPGHAKHGDKEECRPPPRRGPSADADGLLGGRCALGEQGEGITGGVPLTLHPGAPKGLASGIEDVKEVQELVGGATDLIIRGIRPRANIGCGSATT